jgi:alkylation response protein AidB-like acyl-CoA dehydrogenase
MDWNDTPDQATFRDEVKGLVEADLPARYRDGGEDDYGGWQGDRKSEDADVRQAAIDWADALATRGWVAPHWPAEYGGAGLSPMEQFIFKQEMTSAGAPAVGGMGVQMLGPTLIVHGSDEQKAEHLPKILSGDVAWCQGYSEPGSGSDLASLQTRAERDGDEYVINGQKIWTSNAHRADYIAMLVRTDPEAPKHRGISFLLADMDSAGITIRPLINMGWSHGFNEVFFEDVRVPLDNRVGDEHRGWYVSVTLMDFERSRIRQAVSARRQFDATLDYLNSDDGRAKSCVTRSHALRHEFADRATEIEISFNLAFRVVSMQASGVVPNYEASMLQMSIFETNQRTARTEARAYGLYTNLWDEDEPWAPRNAAPGRGYVQAVAATVAGGTSEIQRNIIATRGLGLPRG